MINILNYNNSNYFSVMPITDEVHGASTPAKLCNIFKDIVKKAAWFQSSYSITVC